MKTYKDIDLRLKLSMPLLVSISYKDIKIQQQKTIQHLLEETCLKTSHSLHILKKLYFDTIITTPKQMQYINSCYRKINKPTDVLSFALHDVQPQTNLLGEIYINWSDVIKNAKENKTQPLKELCVLFIHGLLHLLRYNHEKIQDRKKMNALEKRIISQITVK